jgi:hypothetical protein
MTATLKRLSRRSIGAMSNLSNWVWVAMLLLVGGLIVFSVSSRRSIAELFSNVSINRWNDIVIVSIDVSRQTVSGTQMQQLIGAWEWNNYASHSQFSIVNHRDSLVLIVDGERVRCCWAGETSLEPEFSRTKAFVGVRLDEQTVESLEVDLTAMALVKTPETNNEATREPLVYRLSTQAKKDEVGFEEIALRGYAADRNPVEYHFATSTATYKLIFTAEKPPAAQRLIFIKLKGELIRIDTNQTMVTFEIDAETGNWLVTDPHHITHEGNLLTNSLVARTDRNSPDNPKLWPYPEKFTDGVLRFQEVFRD